MWRHLTFKPFRHDILVFLNLDFSMLGNYISKTIFLPYLFVPSKVSLVCTEYPYSV